MLTVVTWLSCLDSFSLVGGNEMTFATMQVMTQGGYLSGILGRIQHARLMLFIVIMSPT